MPKEEDLNSWSHHYSTDTADDPVFRGAMVRHSPLKCPFLFFARINCKRENEEGD